MPPIYLIMTTGRTGSDYLHGCLDGLDSVMSICGKFEYHSFLEKNNEIKDNKILIEKFVYENKRLFSYDQIEDIDTKEEIEKFKKFFLNLSDNKKLNRRDFFFNIYKSYNLTINKNLKNMKALVHHSHGLNNTKKCLRDFPKAKLLITIRDPRANLKSGLENWFCYDNKKKYGTYIFIYQKDKRRLKIWSKIKNEKLFVKLENAGEFNTKKKVCNFLSIPYDEKVETATFNSIPWRGDSLSQIKSKNGEYNIEVRNNNWEKYFLEKRLKF